MAPSRVRTSGSNSDDSLHAGSGEALAERVAFEKRKSPCDPRTSGLVRCPSPVNLVNTYLIFPCFADRRVEPDEQRLERLSLTTDQCGELLVFVAGDRGAGRPMFQVTLSPPRELPPSMKAPLS